MAYRRKAEICTPDIPLKAMAWLYYIHQNTPYPVSGSPTSVFKSALRDLHPRPFGERMEELLGQDELDTVSRWWILNEMIALRTPMKLYTSKFQAEKACVTYAANNS